MNFLTHDFLSISQGVGGGEKVCHYLLAVAAVKHKSNIVKLRLLLSLHRGRRIINVCGVVGTPGLALQGILISRLRVRYHPTTRDAHGPIGPHQGALLEC
eukprot:7560076-Pyramimonas_sp.AAC.1